LNHAFSDYYSLSISYRIGAFFHNSYSNYTKFPSIYSPLLNVSVSANKNEVCAKISIIDIRRIILSSRPSPRHLKGWDWESGWENWSRNI